MKHFDSVFSIQGKAAKTKGRVQSPFHSRQNRFPNPFCERKVVLREIRHPRDFDLNLSTALILIAGGQGSVGKLPRPDPRDPGWRGVRCARGVPARFSTLSASRRIARGEILTVPARSRGGRHGGMGRNGTRRRRFSDRPTDRLYHYTEVWSWRKSQRVDGEEERDGGDVYTKTFPSSRKGFFLSS